MKETSFETDYLVIGAGAAGMAFTDSLIAHSDAKVIMVDRRHAPGGHWNEAYPFVRLHQPSAYYGVNSLPLEQDWIDRHGTNRGYAECASGPEIEAYFRRVMEQQLLPSGQVRYFPMCNYDGEHRFTSLVSGQTFEVNVRRKVVDARYLQPSVPASTPPPFSVADGVRCIPVNDLTRVSEKADRMVIIGAGKTAMDACLWLLDLGVPPESICWIKPRDAWLTNRKYFQPGDLAFEGNSLAVEAAAHAASMRDIYAHLERCGYMVRIDENREPEIFRYATINELELAQLRNIRNVVRLGKIRHIDQNEIVLNDGAISASKQDIHVHCAAAGLNSAPGVPIFAPAKITLQPILIGLTPLAAAMTGYIEAAFDDLDEMNNFCPPNPYPNITSDLVRGLLTQLKATSEWFGRPELAAWLEQARLNPIRGIATRADEPHVRQSMTRFLQNADAAVTNLERLRH
ncbi:MAG: NAD(P)-binding protein [Alphaproteobacteria bacterium]